MPTISKIIVAKRNKGRFHIYITGREGKDEYAFTVSEDLFIKRHIRKGMKLTEAEIAEIREEDLLDKAMQKVLNYLSYRMRSEKEVYHYLADLEVQKDDALQIIDRLKELQFLNDKLFAEAFVRTKKNTQKKGPMLIEQELYEKGIAKQLIEESMKKYSEEEQLEHAITIASKKQSSYRKEAQKLRKQKTYQFLLQKGFTSTIASQAVEECDQEIDRSMEWEAITKQGDKAQKKFSKYEGWEREQRIKQFLFQRGFSQDLIEEWLRGIDENEDS